jgi:hypothetical protein
LDLHALVQQLRGFGDGPPIRLNMPGANCRLRFRACRGIAM